MHINLEKPQPWKPRAWYGCPEQIALCCICVGYGLTMQIKMLFKEHDVDVLNRLHLCGLLACLSCAWEHDTSTRNHNVENSIVWVSWIDCIAGFVPRALKNGRTIMWIAWLDCKALHVSAFCLHQAHEQRVGLGWQAILSFWVFLLILCAKQLWVLSASTCLNPSNCEILSVSIGLMCKAIVSLECFHRS